jgi:gamma-glutamyltranspeptidase/glutathione hydrolase
MDGMRIQHASGSPKPARVRLIHVVTWMLVAQLAQPVALAQRAPVEARHGMVVSANELASGIGVDIMKRGGNAADAAVATGIALAVVYPRAGNLGGGGFATVRLANGKATTIDFRETAPAAASRDMYLDANGQVISGQSTVGYKAAGVPGTVAGLALLHRKYGSGKLSWSELLEPAHRLAEQGFVVSSNFANDLRSSERVLGRFPESKRIFLRDGKYYTEGETFRQPELAKTLQRMQKSGAREFYTGETAKLIAAEMTAHDGTIALADLAAYEAVERPALTGTYRGYGIVTMGPPSSGGIALLQMLGMLEPRDVGALAYHSAAQIHLFVEVMRRAFRDRANFLGDADFVQVPMERLLDKTYIAGLMKDFDPAHATPSNALKASAIPPPESTDTTQFSVVDAAGNAVSITYTLNGLYGNGVTVPGAGFLLNNEMDDFTSKVGAPNGYGLIQGESNAIAPGKRPLSSMTPTIVTEGGKPFLVTGSPGGPTIINTVLQVITNVIDFRMNVTGAVDAPRFHHQWQPDEIRHEPDFTTEETVAQLKSEGYQLATRRTYANATAAEGRSMGDAESIMVEPKSGLRMGASDIRSADAGAVGF